MKVITPQQNFPSKNTSYPRVIVPTMGALHDGHLALIRRAQELAGASGEVVVTIFVNPTQFNNPNDLDNYPKTLSADLDLCRLNGADLVYTPDNHSMYHPDHSVSVIEKSLSKRLCGATRPGHFEGVCTVVLKFFNITAADIGVFGKKDFQQLAIIQRMVRDLQLPIQIEGVETVREPSGLALSSRNTRLSKEQHLDAPRIRNALLETQKLYRSGEKITKKLLAITCNVIEASSEGAKIDYLELLNATTLQPVERVDEPAIIAAAVFYGEVRLIDNIELS